MRLLIVNELLGNKFNISIRLATAFALVVIYKIITTGLHSFCFTTNYGFNVNTFGDIDLTVSTDFEDFAVIVSDVFEVLEHDRALLVDGGFEFFLTRSVVSFSSLSTSTIR